MTVGQGLTRLRTVQIGVQTVFGTAVAATVRLPWRGGIDYDPNRTDPDVDVGSIDPVLPQIVGAPTIGLATSGPQVYNALPYRLNAGLKGGVTPTGGGAAKTWTYTLASLTADPFQYFTLQTGDDTSATGGIVGFGGVIDSLTDDLPDNLDGPWTFSDAWIFAGATLATDRTAALVVDPAPVYAQADETQLWIDTAAGSIGTTLFTDALHSASVSVANNLDKKRLANGSNSRRQYAGWARGARTIDIVLTMAETSQVLAEVATLSTVPGPNRFIRLKTTSETEAQGGTPYSDTINAAARLISVTDGEAGGNATKVLTYRAYYDATLTYAFQRVVVCTLTAV